MANLVGDDISQNIMNNVTLIGNLVRDPELTYVNKDNEKVAVINFTLAAPRYFYSNGKKVSETAYLDCVVWNSGAEYIANNCQKGSRLFVTGSLKNKVWEKDGIKRSKVEVRVESFELFNYKRQSTESSVDNQQEVSY